MTRAYKHARRSLIEALCEEDFVVELGAATGNLNRILRDNTEKSFQYLGLEWNDDLLLRAESSGNDVQWADLNSEIKLDDNSVDHVIGLSILEHLINPCRCINECYRVLTPGGRLILLTPNIATYFTCLQLLLGRMPSSGPHLDSNHLIKANALHAVQKCGQGDVEEENPVTRHFIIHSFLSLQKLLTSSGFLIKDAKAYGYYPLPKFFMPLCESIDPYHSHQMVFIAEKPKGSDFTDATKDSESAQTNSLP